MGFFFLTFLRELAEGEAFAVGKKQSDGNDGDKGDQPEHDAATCRELLRHIEDVAQSGDGGELRTSADSGELD